MKTKFIISAKKMTNTQTNTQFPVFFLVKENSDKVAKLIPLEGSVNMPKAPFRKVATIDTANLSLKQESYVNKDGEVKNRTVAFIDPSEIDWMSDDEAKEDIAKANEQKAEKLL